MSQKLSNSTRYLVVAFKRFPGSQSQYRRGGVTFTAEESLVDIEKVGPENAKAILSDKHLHVVQLSKEQGAKFAKARPPVPQSSEDIATLREANRKLAKQLAVERKTSAELVAQNEALLDQVETLQRNYEAIAEHLDQKALEAAADQNAKLVEE